MPTAAAAGMAATAAKSTARMPAGEPMPATMRRNGREPMPAPVVTPVITTKSAPAAAIRADIISVAPAAIIRAVRLVISGAIFVIPAAAAARIYGASGDNPGQQQPAQGPCPAPRKPAHFVT